MLIVRGNTDKLQVVTAQSADIEVHVSAMQADASTPPVVQPLPNFGPMASITGTTTTDIVDATGLTSGHVYNVKHLNLYNNHGSQSCVVTVQNTDGTNIAVLAKVTLLSGEMLVYTEAGMWLHYDSNGALYPAIGNAASQAEMEAGTATDRYVTPVGVNWHPGSCKAWGKCTVSGGVPTLAVNWNITSITDAGPSRLTVTIGIDFSGANYVINPAIEASSTTYSATTQSLIPVIRNATQAAGSFSLDAVEIDIGQANDPAAWHFSCYGDQ